MLSDKINKLSELIGPKESCLTEPCPFEGIFRGDGDFSLEIETSGAVRIFANLRGFNVGCYIRTIDGWTGTVPREASDEVEALIDQAIGAINEFDDDVVCGGCGKAIYKKDLTLCRLCKCEMHMGCQCICYAR